MPERRVLIAADGSVASIQLRERLDSHKLIEEFMIAANVAAAETLEERKAPAMYRVHDQPSREKLESLREFLGTLDIRLPRGQVLRPRDFNRILAKAEGRPEARLVNEVVLRSQAQAAYDPVNIGHFGLALRRYCHFTSPIRRYADLLVHRAADHAPCAPAMTAWPATAPTSSASPSTSPAPNGVRRRPNAMPSTASPRPFWPNRSAR